MTTKSILCAALSDAEHDIEVVGQIAQDLDQAVWDLQSAVSLVDKARSGYRSSPRTGDRPWSLEQQFEQLAEARSALDAAVINALSALAKA